MWVPCKNLSHLIMFTNDWEWVTGYEKCLVTRRFLLFMWAHTTMFNQFIFLFLLSWIYSLVRLICWFYYHCKLTLQALSWLVMISLNMQKISVERFNVFKRKYFKTILMLGDVFRSVTLECAWFYIFVENLSIRI